MRRFPPFPSTAGTRTVGEREEMQCSIPRHRNEEEICCGLARRSTQPHRQTGLRFTERQVIRFPTLLSSLLFFSLLAEQAILIRSRITDPETLQRRRKVDEQSLGLLLILHMIIVLHYVALLLLTEIVSHTITTHDGLLRMKSCLFLLFFLPLTCCHCY